MVSRVKELMDKRENIRNIGIVAHIDHGKCVSSESKIALADGRMMKARELYDEVRKSGNKLNISDTNPVSGLNKDKIDEAYEPDQEKGIASLDRSTGRTVEDTLLYACKGTSDRTIKITTSNGHSLKTTPEHEFLTLSQDGSMGFKQADRLEEGCIVIGIRNLPFEGSEKVVDQIKSNIKDELDLISSFISKTLNLDTPSIFYITGILNASIFDGWTIPEPDIIKSALKIPYEEAEDIYEFLEELDTEKEIKEIKEEIGPLNLHNIANDIHGATTDAISTYIAGFIDSTGKIEDNLSVVFPDNRLDASELNAIPEIRERVKNIQNLLYRFDVASMDEKYTLKVEGLPSIQNLLESIPSGKLEGLDIHSESNKIEVKTESEKNKIFEVPPAQIDNVPINSSLLEEATENMEEPCNSKEYTDGQTITKTSLSSFVEDVSQNSDQNLGRLRALSKADTSFVEVENIQELDGEEVFDFGVKDHKNFISNGIVVHNTTLTDNLLAGAGMISEELAGEQLFMDFDEEEQERGITIDAANVSMVHDFTDDHYLINLIDTPGHVDFGGDVTRAMRAVDGAVVVVDAVEGCMPQTETVLRQAVKENVKPVLFINKIDRLINELELSEQEMQQKFVQIINEVNQLTSGMIEDEERKKEWKVSVNDGSVAFGSALYNWALSYPYMEETGITFKDIVDYCKDEEHKKLYEKAPIHQIVLNMVIRHLPNPLKAQRYRIPTIWDGDIDRDIGESMINADPDSDTAFMVTDISIDPHAGEVATGRLFAGTLEEGTEVNISGVPGKNRIQQVGIFMGPERVNVDKVPAGNIAAITGLGDAIAGSTVSTVELTPFESIKHISEPVVTVAVEAKRMKDLPKLIEVLRQVSREDPTVHVDIDEETGEHLISGMGELHLDIITHRIERDKGVSIETSEPIVVYRETVKGSDGPIEAKSPNKHNKFYLMVEPLPDEVVSEIKEGNATMDMPERKRRDVLMEAGMDKDDAKNVKSLHKSNAFVDSTKGVQYLRDTIELVLEAFEEAMDSGPLANEPCRGVLVRLDDVKLHEDAVHRGPAQVIPAVRKGILAVMSHADPTLLEPMQKVYVNTPQDTMGGASREIQGRRGKILNMEHKGDLTTIEATAPVAEMFGFAGDLRSATEGRAMWSTEPADFSEVPKSIIDDIINEIKERKGLNVQT